MKYQKTSGEAFAAIQPVSGTLDDGIMSCLYAVLGRGMTCEEIENNIYRKHQAVSGNLRHLVERGLVVNSGRYRNTSSGRRAIVWVASVVARGDERNAA